MRGVCLHLIAAMSVPYPGPGPTNLIFLSDFGPVLITQASLVDAGLALTLASVT